jgi:transcription termination factor NusB
MSDIKTLKLKVSSLDSIVTATSISLPFERSRARNTFVKLLAPFISAKEEARLDIVKKYVEHDEKGEPKIEGSNYVIPQDKMKEFTDEITKMMNEEVTVDVLPEMEKTILQFAEIIKDNKSPLGITESVALVDFVDAVDALELQ